MAPQMSAGVMIANISWKARNANGGIVSAEPVGDTVPALCIHARSKLPMRSPVPEKTNE